MTLWRGVFVGMAACTVAGAGHAQPATRAEDPIRSPPLVLGYLRPSTAPDAVAILPPPPQPGSPAYERDRAIFRGTRASQIPGRWALAIADTDSGVAAVMADFRCSAAVDLTSANAPHLTHLLNEVRSDVGLINFRSKWRFHRQRPFLIDAGRLCVTRTAFLDTSPDYPSGHSIWGWAAGLVLAELVPERSTPILVRARAYGESRVVCGAHNASAVEAGRTYGAAMIAAEHGVAAFRRDLEAARAEVAQARAASPDLAVADACRSEAALIGQRPFAD
jgi:acid phosphatase (class A)